MRLEDPINNAMVRRRSQKAAESNRLVEEAVAGVYSGKYKTGHKAAAVLGANRGTVYNRLAGKPTRSTARLN